MTATDQGTLLGSTCRECGAAIPYCGHGRKRSLCDACYPESYPARKLATNDRRPVSAPLARASDPPTSAEAAASITPGHVEARILAAFDAFGWLTDDELADQIPDAHPPTVKAARSRLSKAGVLVDTGSRRPSNRGRLMCVWARA